VTHLISTYGLPLLFVAVFVESAGLPFIPGELALIAAALAAQEGKFSIVWVIVVAAVGAVGGFTAGYWIGRTGGRRILDRWRLTRRYAAKALPPAQRFFERHGTKTIFLARFIAVLRGTAALIAGITDMEWWPFFAWNVAGGLVWAIGYGLLAYYAGKAVVDTISTYGSYGLLGAAVVVGAGWLVMRRVHKRLEH
jgi:membrane protein DedA with SNARE-associated domain